MPERRRGWPLCRWQSTTKGSEEMKERKKEIENDQNPRLAVLELRDLSEPGVKVLLVLGLVGVRVLRRMNGAGGWASE